MRTIRSERMVELLVTYLDMNAPPAGEPLAAPVPGAVVKRERLNIEDYLALYRAVGDPLDWDVRLRMPETELSALLDRESTWVHVLRVDGRPAGLCEFNEVGQAVVELTYFGLTKAFYGQRLGPYLLDYSLRSVWSQGAKRIWLHTDTNDHPKAQSVYRRAGFALRERRIETFPD